MAEPPHEFRETASIVLEAQRRLEAALRGAREVGHTPMRDRTAEHMRKPRDNILAAKAIKPNVAEEFARYGL